MNNKDLNELFDIEAMTEAFWELTRCQAPETAKELLKAATADREYQLVPEVRDWLQGEEIPEVPFNCLHGGTPVTVEEVNEISGCLIRCSDNSIGVVHSMGLKPIPRIKKINHSSLVGSGIDCEYTNNVKETWINVYDENTDERTLVSIRLNHPMALTAEQIKAIPEGYQKWGYNGKDWIKFDECDLGDESFTVVEVTIADGWEL